MLWKFKRPGAPVQALKASERRRRSDWPLGEIMMRRPGQFCERIFIFGNFKGLASQLCGQHPL